MYLLDVNVLIALAWDDHEHHNRAHGWFGQAGQSFATCNVTQNGFVRLSLNPKVVHCQIGISDAFEMLKSFTAHPNHTFCEDGALRPESPFWLRVAGHADVTDTNLLSIAHSHGRKFVTLDDGIQNRLVRDEKNWVEVIPR